MDDTELQERVFDYQLKYILVGDSGSGKTSLLHSYLHRNFNPDTPSTIGVQFVSTYLKLQTPTTPVSTPEVSTSPNFLRRHKVRPSLSGPTLETRTVKLNIFDTAGTERFRSITKQYYRSAVGVLLLYDITRRDTFLNLDSWLRDIRALTAQSSIVVLVGTKVDTAEAARQVSFAEGEQYAQDNNIAFIEVSSISGENVDQTFQLLTQAVILGVQSGLFDPQKPNSGVILGVRRATSYSLLRPEASGVRSSSWIPTSSCCSG